jgi:hypothetical protein
LKSFFRLAIRIIFSFVVVPAIIILGFVAAFIRPGIANPMPLSAGFGIASGITWALGSLGISPWFNNFMNVLAAFCAVTSAGFGIPPDDLCMPHQAFTGPPGLFHPVALLCHLQREYGITTPG